MDAVYIAVLPSKEKQLWLCDADADGRKKAVDLLKTCIDDAAANGISRVMINSGRTAGSVDEELTALEDSVRQLYEYAAKKNIPFRLCLEPCDSIREAFHLIGPYRRTREFTERLRGLGFPLELTMDSAHTAEENEDFAAALAATRPYCNHIHFANCRIADPTDPLYGDKHIGLEYSGSVWTPETLETLFREIEPPSPGDEPVQIALEILCREDDPYAYFEKTWDSVPFLSKK